MTALADKRDTQRLGRAGTITALGCAANTTFYQGALICKNASGYAVPGATATTLISIGVYERPTFTSSAVAGAEKIEIIGGDYGFANSASTDQITIADIGNLAFVVDDQTVARTNGTNTRSVCGPIVAVDASGVYVNIDVKGRK